MVIDEQEQKLKRLQQRLLSSAGFENGFRNIQAELISAVRHGLISNQTQQTILEICQPVRLGTAFEPKVSAAIVTSITEAIAAEIRTWRQVSGR